MYMGINLSNAFSMSSRWNNWQIWKQHFKPIAIIWNTLWIPFFGFRMHQLYSNFIFLISWILYVQLIIERNGVQQHYLREQYSSGYLQVWLLQLEIAYFSFSQLYHFVSVFVFVNFGQILNWKKSDFNLFKGCFMKKNGTKSLKNSKSPDFLK
jgi:hypothetical protein